MFVLINCSTFKGIQWKHNTDELSSMLKKHALHERIHSRTWRNGNNYMKFLLIKQSKSVIAE